MAGNAQQGTSPVARFSPHADRDGHVEQLSGPFAVPSLCQAPAKENVEEFPFCGPKSL